ncbi:RAMP superfamily CRISPR-associated protein [Desulfuribacillus alkaliarsenatis]|uniref:CRISPR type III-associated protein domain-containing protein n=1 Tax=Desulfuribacillus alkaliarsenatis TaxID=766136 RepID=A0A1E5G3I2_9FIRM|nr:RAMP superfamily CRISPR-associated protein [Desulfuribacillus alkaliarsenatis]OEF97142.1 hypothetical protein BHF68_05975 [Desulfuribacillus alkaliarsenatis]
MYEYRVLEFRSIEPLKIGAGGNKSIFTEPTKEYLPGSTIRGALISQLVRYGLFNENKNSILHNLKCYNAYPYVEDIKALFLPTPYHLRMDKHDWRKKKSSKGENNEIDIANLSLDSNNNHNAKNHLKYSFLSEVDGRLHGVQVQKEFRLHHTTAIKGDEPENLFRYEAISSGQVFRSLLKYSKDLSSHIKQILSSTETVYIGGSKGSGYGKCKVTPVGDSYIEYDEAINALGFRFKRNKDKTNEMVVVCLSDCVFRDEYGQPTNYLSDDFIYQLSGIKVNIGRRFIQTGLTEGYNTKWNARYPKEATLKAGTVLVFNMPEGISMTDRDRVGKLLEQNLLGYRTQDGYGWLGIDLDYPNKLMLNELKNIENNNTAASQSTSGLYDFKLDEQMQTFKTILSGLANAKMRWLHMIVIKCSANSNDDYRLIINKELRNNHINKFIKELEKYIEKITIKNHLHIEPLQNRYAKNDKQFSFAGYNFNEICEFLNKKKNNKLESFTKNKINSKLGQLFYNDTNEEFRHKIFLIDLLLAGLHVERRLDGNDTGE